MKTLLEILGFCKHVWCVIGSAELISTYNGKQVGRIFHVQCKHCGKVKTLLTRSSNMI